MGARYELDPETVRKLYCDRRMSIAEVAQELDASERPVRRAMRAAGIEPRHSGPCPRKNPRPRKIRQDPFGYLLEHRPEHPHAESNGYVRQHRLVLEAKLGRFLDPKEDVHHIDGDKSNNHPDNLELMASRGDHVRHHNLLRSSARNLKELSNCEIQLLYAQHSTVPLAKMFGTSPATVQRELQRRGIAMKCGPRTPRGGRRRKQPGPTSSDHSKSGPGDTES